MRNNTFSLTALLVLFLFISSCNKFGSNALQLHELRGSTEVSELIHNNDENNLANFIFVRHAEKQTGDDPSLTEEGVLRAQTLSKILEKVSLKAIYSSDYNRTKETAFATAKAKKIATKIYNPRDLNGFANFLLETHKEGNILVVGHSNSTPTLINHLLQDAGLEQIPESQYDDLFILSKNKENQLELEHIKYGK